MAVAAAIGAVELRPFASNGEDFGLWLPRGTRLSLRSVRAGAAYRARGCASDERQQEADLRVREPRSAFRDWVGDETGFQRETAEAALAHLVGDQAERAYRRGDAFNKRRELMDAWATFVMGDGEAAKVVPLSVAKRRGKRR
jgi:hypothetical protein